VLIFSRQLCQPGLCAVGYNTFEQCGDRFGEPREQQHAGYVKKNMGVGYLPGMVVPWRDPGGQICQLPLQDHTDDYRCYIKCQVKYARAHGAFRSTKCLIVNELLCKSRAVEISCGIPEKAYRQRL
jgi:hypothetical protein